MENQKIIKLNISKEMKTSFLDYSMSVIVSRALPDVRDGLKPVHRRILHAMNDLGMHADKPFKKSARIVGEVIGKYHPHGDIAVYDAMVRMAQYFAYRYELVSGQGNFGSIDGDGAAAMRYTEAKISKIGMELLKDINKDTVDFQDNFDGEEREPVVLPARFPNLLANGASGIAVGMATNIPPHNLSELIDATLTIIDNPDISVLDLMENVISGPDFPTGGLILGQVGIKKAFETGRGSILIRSKTQISTLANGKKQIIVTEIPYQVNKSLLVEKIASLVRDKVIDGITDLRDESNKKGIRIVIELRKDVQEEVILNQLYRMSSLQVSFGINMLSLVKGEPKLLGIIDILKHYINHQIDVTVRRTQFELNKAKDREHILKGLIIALDFIDEVIAIIRANRDESNAKNALIERFDLSEIQAQAILNMQFKRLTGLERDKLVKEHDELVTLIADLEDILANESRVLGIIKEELTAVKERYGDDRLTEIVEYEGDMVDEDLIPIEDIVITRTLNGYIKRNTVDTYKTQNRGGKGVKGMSINEDDIVDEIIFMSTHDDLLLFSNLGKVYRIKGYQVPGVSRIAKGLPLVNLLNLAKYEKINTLISIAKGLDFEGKHLTFITKLGKAKRVKIDEFTRINKAGKKAIVLPDEDELVAVRLTNGDDELIIAGSNGKANRISESSIRSMGRSAYGVKAFNIDGGYVIGMASSNNGEYLISISENGYGKKSNIEDYRLSNRGSKGVKALTVTEKTGDLKAIRAVSGDEDLMIITNLGTVIRISLENVSTLSRTAQGVRLINVKDGEIVSKIAVISKEDKEEEIND